MSDQAIAAAQSFSFRDADQILRPPEDGLPYLRHNRAAELELEGGSLTIDNGRFVGFNSDTSTDVTVDTSACALIPGFVDCHTHLPFIGWREKEYAQKVGGVLYEEIALCGGGIASSARSFDEADDQQVLTFASRLAREMLQHGTTTFECKSGYGLTVENELRALRLAAQLDDQVPQTTVSTALLAHAVPEGYDADSWLDEVAAMLPAVLEQTRASALDIYVESVAFDNKHLQRMGELASANSLTLRCHVEQFARHHSVPVAVAGGARSVDHLACLDPADIAGLAEAECAAGLLPGAEFLGAEELAPGRELADAGAICMLATDLNPGTSPIVSLPIIIGLAVRRYNWTIREALLAATLNAAWTIEKSSELGSIEVGKRADLLVLDGPVEQIPYRFGHNPVAAAFIAGKPTFIRPDAAWRFTTTQ